jgi:hypothetical protein
MGILSGSDRGAGSAGRRIRRRIDDRGRELFAAAAIVAVILECSAGCDRRFEALGRQ